MPFDYRTATQPRGRNITAKFEKQIGYFSILTFVVTTTIFIQNSFQSTEQMIINNLMQTYVGKSLLRGSRLASKDLLFRTWLKENLRSLQKLLSTVISLVCSILALEIRGKSIS